MFESFTRLGFAVGMNGWPPKFSRFPNFDWQVAHDPSHPGHSRTVAPTAGNGDGSFDKVIVTAPEETGLDLRMAIR